MLSSNPSNGAKLVERSRDGQVRNVEEASAQVIRGCGDDLLMIGDWTPVVQIPKNVPLERLDNDSLHILPTSRVPESE